VFISDGDVYCIGGIYLSDGDVLYRIEVVFISHGRRLLSVGIYIERDVYCRVEWPLIRRRRLLYPECVISHRGRHLLYQWLFTYQTETFTVSVEYPYQTGRRILSVGIYIRRRRLLYQWYLYQTETYTVSGIYISDGDVYCISGYLYQTGDVYCISDIYTTETFTVSVGIALSDRERLLYRWVSDRETFVYPVGIY
jgi:hypothetical protein